MLIPPPKPIITEPEQTEVNPQEFGTFFSILERDTVDIYSFN